MSSIDQAIQDLSERTRDLLNLAAQMTADLVTLQGAVMNHQAASPGPTQSTNQTTGNLNTAPATNAAPAAKKQRTKVVVQGPLKDLIDEYEEDEKQAASIQPVRQAPYAVVLVGVERTPGNTYMAVVQDPQNKNVRGSWPCDEDLYEEWEESDKTPDSILLDAQELNAVSWDCVDLSEPLDDQDQDEDDV